MYNHEWNMRETNLTPKSLLFGKNKIKSFSSSGFQIYRLHWYWIYLQFQFVIKKKESHGPYCSHENTGNLQLFFFFHKSYEVNKQSYLWWYILDLMKEIFNKMHKSVHFKQKFKEKPLWWYVGNIEPFHKIWELILENMLKIKKKTQYSPQVKITSSIMITFLIHLGA